MLDCSTSTCRYMHTDEYIHQNTLPECQSTKEKFIDVAPYLYVKSIMCQYFPVLLLLLPHFCRFVRQIMQQFATVMNIAANGCLEICKAKERKKHTTTTTNENRSETYNIQYRISRSLYANKFQCYDYSK